MAIILVSPGAANFIDNRDQVEYPGYAGNGPAPVSTHDEQDGAGGPVILPFIANNETAGMIKRQYTFSFQQTNITIRTNVSTAVYYGAKNGDKFALSPHGVAPESLAPDYYRAFVDDPHQEPLYTDILREFRTIREERHYTGDEYLELLTVFVQSIPYDNESAANPDTLSRFPVETIVDGIGDCDDKSVLLAGLLSREGYNVSLLLFIPEHHMALGVKSDCMQYGDTGYTYVETTGVSFIGDVPGRLIQSEKYVSSGQAVQKIPITSLPLVIRVGTGSKDYTSADTSGYIMHQKKAIDERIASIRERLDNTSWENPSRYRTLMESYTMYADMHNYIITHEQDRAGTFRYLISRMSAADSYGIQKCNLRCLDDIVNDENEPAWYMPCPRGIWVPQRCIWQSVQQDMVIPFPYLNHPGKC
ncbi:MAG: hypothetical protein M0Q92_02550 [Methanoregula sp.]|nr:hypothetical protein [Methanoregula sp.]